MTRNLSHKNSALWKSKCKVCHRNFCSNASIDFGVCHARQAHSWSQFLSKFNSKHLKSEKREFMTNIKFFTTKQKFRTPTAQTIFRFSEEMTAFSGRNQMFNGDLFCCDSSEWHFRRHKCPKKTKNYFFALEVAKRPFGPAKAKSSRRVLRTISQR